MQTAAISYRVADFLKQYPPFQHMDEADLVGLAGQGRVRFHEAEEFILWEGTPLPDYVYVIQQGTVSLWQTDEGEERLCDIRGTGDIIGIDRFHGHTINQHSAKAASDVMLYAVPASRVAELLDKYPQAAHYVQAHASVTAGYSPLDHRKGADELFVHDTAVRRAPTICGLADSMQLAARRMAAQGTSAVAVLEARGKLAGVVSVADLVRAVAEDGFHPGQPVTKWMQRDPPVLPPSATVSDCILAIAETDSDVAVLSSGDSLQPQRLVSFFDLAPAFGDHPVGILREILHAPSTEALAVLQQRARIFVLDQLLAPASIDWLMQFLYHVDRTIVHRLAQLDPPPHGEYLWCFYGAAGRGESLPPVQQRSLLVLPDSSRRPEFIEWHRRMNEALANCGYLRREPHFDDAFSCADLTEWTGRYRGWIEDPVTTEFHHARPLFDVRPVIGDHMLWRGLYENVRKIEEPSESFVRLLAHDCLTKLPPLTFFQDVVVEESGIESSVFHLKQTALRPLVDVGRVFGVAAGRALGGSTLERFRLARTMLPEHDSIFREASDMLRVVLYLQARTAIRQQTGGADLDPALLSHHDRQVLKSGFRAIHQLLEFTADSAWLKVA